MGLGPLSLGWASCSAPQEPVHWVCQDPPAKRPPHLRRQAVQQRGSRVEGQLWGAGSLGLQGIPGGQQQTQCPGKILPPGQHGAGAHGHSTVQGRRGASFQPVPPKGCVRLHGPGSCC